MCTFVGPELRILLRELYLVLSLFTNQSFRTLVWKCVRVHLHFSAISRKLAFNTWSQPFEKSSQYWVRISTRSSYLCATMLRGPSVRFRWCWVPKWVNSYLLSVINLFKSSTDHELQKHSLKTLVCLTFHGLLSGYDSLSSVCRYQAWEKFVL